MKQNGPIAAGIATDGVAATACDIGPVLAWLMDGARTAPEADQALAELCERLITAGVPLWRAAVFVRTLHPDVMGRRFLWRADAGVSNISASFEFLASPEFRASPVAQISASGVPIRCRLDGAEDVDRYPILADLRGEGVTDYFAAPLVFTDGAIHVATWTTRRPGGFSPAQLAGLEAIMPALARVAEVRALRRTAGTLLSVYVGGNAGERILAGQIRRGDTTAIHAAIWLSDMRGFTALADRLPPQRLIDLLNLYFDCQVPVIAVAGGEVLKFMGDGLLALFPCGEDEAGPHAVCGRALAAARETREKVAGLAGSTGIEGLDAVRFGLALHIGEVLYGNVGGGGRLDFTCIGPAVNLAARLEKLAGRLGRSIVASAAFARLAGEGLAPLGEFALAGVSGAQLVFGLADEVG